MVDLRKAVKPSEASRQPGGNPTLHPSRQVLSDRIRSVLHIFSATFRILWRRKRWAVGGAIVLGMGGALLEGAAIAAVIGFVSLSGEAGGIALPGGIQVTMTPLSTAIFAAIFLGLMVFSGSIAYLGNALNVRTIEDFRTYCMERFIGLNGGALEPRRAYATDPTGFKTIKRMAGEDARRASMAVRVMLNGLDNAFRAGVFGALAFYLEPQATLAVLGLGLGILFWQYRVSRRIHVNDSFLKESQQRATRNIAKYLKSRTTDLSAGDSQFNYASEFTRDTTVQAPIIAFGRFLRLTAFSSFTGHMLLSLGIVAAFAIVLARMATGTIDVAAVVAFIYALRVCLQSGKGVFAVLGGLSRHYRFLRDSIRFLEFTPRNRCSADELTLPPFHVRDRGGEVAEVLPGGVYGLVTPIQPTRYSANFILGPFLTTVGPAVARRLSVAILAEDGAIGPDATFYDVTGFTVPSQLQAEAEINPRLRPAAKACERLLGSATSEIFSPDRPLTEQLGPRRKPARDLVFLASARLIMNPPHLVIVDEMLLRRFRKVMTLLVRSFPKSIVFVVAGEPSGEFSNLGARSACFVVDYDGLWMAKSYDAVLSRAGPIAAHFGHQQARLTEGQATERDQEEEDL